MGRRTPRRSCPAFITGRDARAIERLLGQLPSEKSDRPALGAFSSPDATYAADPAGGRVVLHRRDGIKEAGTGREFIGGWAFPKVEGGESGFAQALPRAWVLDQLSRMGGSARKCSPTLLH